MSLVIQDITELFSGISLAGLRRWARGNPLTLYGLPAVLLIEGLALSHLNLSPEVMAGVGTFFFSLSLVSLAYAWSVGRELAENRGSERQYRTEEHERYANAVGIFLLMGVVAIECTVRSAGGLWGPMWLLVVHLTLVTASTLSYVVVRFVLTGLKRPERHKVWVRIFALSYCLTFITGTSLILIRFPLS